MNQLILSTILLLSALLIIRNPMIKLLIQVILFFFVSLIFLFFDFYFLGLTYIIVYIGAIAILFLFFLMTTHQTTQESNIRMGFGSQGLGGLVAYLLMTEGSEFQLIINNKPELIEMSDIIQFGELFYMTYPIITLLLGMLLLLILIGVIQITN